jgi:hypothetical protein
VGFYYYKARFYAPSLGRFLQTDPLGYAASLNLYAYVQGDPINFADPTGLIENIIVHGTRPSSDGFGFGFDNYFIDQLFRSFNDYARDAVADFAIGVASAVAEAVADADLECIAAGLAAEQLQDSGLVENRLAAASEFLGIDVADLSFVISFDRDAASPFGGAGVSDGLFITGTGAFGIVRGDSFVTGLDLDVGVSMTVVPTAGLSGLSVTAELGIVVFDMFSNRIPTNQGSVRTPGFGLSTPGFSATKSTTNTTVRICGS